MPTSESPVHSANSTPDPDARGQRIDALLSEYSAFRPTPPKSSPVPLDGDLDGLPIPSIT